MRGLEDREHHWNRARAELAFAFRDDHRSAAAAHLKIPALHMRRIAELDRAAATPEMTN